MMTMMATMLGIASQRICKEPQQASTANLFLDTALCSTSFHL
jgi:hypothetical protein